MMMPIADQIVQQYDRLKVSFQNEKRCFSAGYFPQVYCARYSNTHVALVFSRVADLRTSTRTTTFVLSQQSNKKQYGKKVYYCIFRTKLIERYSRQTSNWRTHTLQWNLNCLRLSATEKYETLSSNAGHGQLVTCCDSLAVPISCQDQTAQCSAGVINSAAQLPIRAIAFEVQLHRSA